jgi:uridine kinase
MNPTAPHLIGITGPSGSGKSTLARQLARTLPGQAAVLPIDCYYRDLSSMSPAARAHHNFDSPDAIDAPLLREHVRSLAAGRAVDVPVYDFNTHTRRVRTERLSPGSWVIIEGLFALHWADIRDLYTTRVFIDADDLLCLSRRLARDISERGRTQQEILAQYAEAVRP